jgi:hypothetical protein
MRLIEGGATALTPPAQSSEPPIGLGLATANGPEEPASSDDLFTLVRSLGGIVARFKPFFSKDSQGSEGRSYGASLSSELPYGFAGLPDSLSFTAHRETKPGQTHQRTWVGSGWVGEGGRVELDIGLHQTEKEESLTLGAAWRVSPLPAGRLSLEADADLANQPYGSLLLEGRLSF